MNDVASMQPVVVITGASRGLGAGIARYFSEQGHLLGLCARHEPVLDNQTVTEMVTAAVDVTNAEAVHAFANQVAHELGPIDLWINNAGVLGPIGPLRDIDLSEAAANLQINLLGVIHGSQAFINHRRQVGDGGVLVNISSGAAQHGYAGWSVYSAAKAGVERLTEVIQMEEQASGLRAYALSPGVIDTDMQAQVRESTPQQFPEVERFQRLYRDSQLRQPEHVARYLLHLAFDPSNKNDQVVLRVPD
ncbi:MAG: SDR family oxidoreductase [Acidimicrobiales bacterium]